MEVANTSDGGGEGDSSSISETNGKVEAQDASASTSTTTGNAVQSAGENIKRSKLDNSSEPSHSFALTLSGVGNQEDGSSEALLVNENEHTGNEDAGELPDASEPQRLNDEAMDSSMSDADAEETNNRQESIFDCALSDFSTPDSDYELDDELERRPPTPYLKKPNKNNWFVLSELNNRQLGIRSNKQSSVLFQRRCYGSLHLVERLKLLYKLEEHTGCVNAINFHPNGDLLASGSDDLKVVLWDWQRGRSRISFESNHKSNIFQSRFMPLSGDLLHIVTCARDGQVRLAQVSGQEGFRSSRKLGSHRGPCHKLTVLPDRPQIVISVGEDSMVMRHDLRTPKSEKIHNVVHENCEVPLYSISTHPLNTDEYCVAGRDYFVRTYDQRKPNTPLKLYHPFKEKPRHTEAYHVSCAVYNHNGSEILASYNDEDIYLFDIDSEPGTFVHSYCGHRNVTTIKGVNFFGPKSEFVVSGSDCGFIFFWEKETEAIVQLLHGDDNGVVNCLEPHPQLPYICTSGLDYDVKVWLPLNKQRTSMPHLVECLKLNKRGPPWPALGSDLPPHFSDVSNAEMLLIFWRELQGRGTLFNMEMDDSSNHSSSSSSSSSSNSTSLSWSDIEPSSNNEEGPDNCSPS